MKLTRPLSKIGLFGGQESGQASLSNRNGAAGPRFLIRPSPIRHELPPIVPLKHARYPWGNLKETGKVTIGLGMLSHDGVVIAADRQLGMTEFLKMGRGKIAFANSGPFPGDPGELSSFAVTGAGNVHYLEHLQRHFLNQHGAIHEFKDLVERDIQAFYRDHVLPFSVYPPNERPDVWLILAAVRNGKKLLLYTEKNVVTESFDCCAVGAGAMYANILLQRLFRRLHGTSAMLLAAYVIFQTKECIDGCGNETDIICLQADGVHYFGAEQMERIEDLFRAYAKVETDLVHCIFSGKNEPALDTIGTVANDIHRLRESVLAELQSIKPTKWERFHT
jgi:hypothetical protein